MRERTTKPDGSVVTEIDREIEEMLAESIGERFPEANLIGEEHERPTDPNAPYHLAVDPVDGTDAFSQGMPGWTVCVGQIDGDGRPRAGIVYAPAWEEIYVAPGDGTALRNGKPIEDVTFPRALTDTTNVMGDSRMHRLFDLSDFPGKVRSVGSTALHLCQALVFDGVIAAVGRPCKIWDVAAAHAVLRASGHPVRLFDGRSIDYDALLEGDSTRDVVVGGSEESLRVIMDEFPRLRREASVEARDSPQS